jgi:adenylate kinase
MKIYVGGVNAVGKSTLLKETAGKLGYQYIHATTGLLDSLGFEKDYEKLRALTQEERDMKYREYIETLLGNKDQNFLLDAHYLGLVRGKVDRVTDSWLKDFDMFVLVSAPLDDIWGRIKKDSMRDRALFPAGASEVEMKNMLSQYQKQMSEEFERLAKSYGKPHVEIANEENKLEASIRQLTSFIDTELRASI